MTQALYEISPDEYKAPLAIEYDSFADKSDYNTDSLISMLNHFKRIRYFSRHLYNFGKVEEAKEDYVEKEIVAWLSADLTNMAELEPYDWGDIDPETVGEPIDW